MYGADGGEKPIIPGESFATLRYRWRIPWAGLSRFSIIRYQFPPSIGTRPRLVTITQGYRYLGHVENRWLSTIEGEGFMSQEVFRIYSRWGTEQNHRPCSAQRSH